MSSSTVSSEPERESRIPKICSCGVPAVLRISRTTRNPGRAFFRCPVNSTVDHLFKWYDEALLEEIEDLSNWVTTSTERYADLLNLRKQDLEKWSSMAQMRKEDLEKVKAMAKNSEEIMAQFTEGLQGVVDKARKEKHKMAVATFMVGCVVGVVVRCIFP